MEPQCLIHRPRRARVPARGPSNLSLLMAETTVSAPSHPTRAARLSVHELSVHFGDRFALDSISLDVAPAEMVSLVGPNGAGKSTLLRVLAGLLQPSHGKVHGRPSGNGQASSKHQIVYIPQRGEAAWTFPISVLDVALMGRTRGVNRLLPFRHADRMVAMEALERVGMARYAAIQIGQLSGGQQQRVLLARALVQNGDTFLLDEPFAGIDLPTQHLLIEVFMALRNDGSTIVYATHDLEQAEAASDRVALLNRRLIAVGPPGDVMTVENLRATFGGRGLVMTGPSRVVNVER